MSGDVCVSCGVRREAVRTATAEAVSCGCGTFLVRGYWERITARGWVRTMRVRSARRARRGERRDAA
ncbi:hypothetical protein caldi_29780 [Caldinitratiruptor microaerophilus]|uniref:Uncharacterized protein n=1 Tax=Caldinitratiruptor microaerophilus TaxID=671077 RepID=A0AA35CNU0_9FIRM|nr:hypothetical protein caldi_29780 [Caldinitratiruptor microaerophilus]